MRVERIALENFKPYADADLRLDRGVTVVHGLNGSGKSSLLEAAFFALYGTDALEGPTAEAVTTGAEEAAVALEFVHDGASYRLERELRIRDGQVGSHDCVLETPEGPIDGVTDVEAHIRELLRMDSEAFLNCAYVRQGEVNKLIDASPDERQDMIDALLQLGALEEYRDRAGTARLGVEDVLTDRRGALEELETQIAEAEDRALPARLNELESTLADVDEELERLRTNREEAVADRDEARSVLDAHEDRQEELSDLEAEIETLEDRVEETAAERESLSEELAAVRERRDEAAAEAADLAADLDLEIEVDIEEPDTEAAATHREELQAELDATRETHQSARETVTSARTEAEGHRERAEDRASRAEEARTEAAEHEADAETLAAELEAARETSETARERVGELQASFEDAPVDPAEVPELVDERQAELVAARERVAECEAELENARERVSEAEQLLDRGECPRCGQPVEDEAHADALGERRAEVEDLEAELEAARADREAAQEALESAETLAERAEELADAEETAELAAERVTELEAELEETREAAETAREEASELEAEAEEARAAAEELAGDAETAKERVGELNARLQELEAAVETVEALQTALQAVAEAATEADRLVERRADLADRNDERRERLTDLRGRRRELREAVDEEAVAAAREQVQEATDYIAAVDEELEELRERRDDLQAERGAVTNALEELDRRRERATELRDRVARLESLHEETGELEALYGDLRAELRQRNVDTLEGLLNETFELVYGNDSYDRIELSPTYELTVYQKDGEPLDPDQLSGGERALFNLSLRCAVYQLLAEGVEGSAPMPPLVLDEPTVFLDAGHVSRLVDLVETMRAEVGVEQIVLVSHDDELERAADALVRVEKDPRTNRSHVEREVAAPADD